MKISNLLGVYGFILFGFSVWFWWAYGHPTNIIINYPPITSLAVIVSVLSMAFLLWKPKVVKILFGSEKDVRERLLELLGTIFIGFVLMLTLLWSLKAQTGVLHIDAYLQSLLIVMLFLFFAGSFYYILVKENL